MHVVVHDSLPDTPGLSGTRASPAKFVRISLTGTVDPDQLRAWEPLATKVTLSEGGTQSISLKLMR